ncbi:DUF1287 domain-containing protein [Brumimicrobium salinarum]|uniref:DUF1287 domain-containing protein n=1 Tax=Brumimicrobium salinarum TaxID=2058658 RepID=A0A2I0R1Q4_9FLAO|nr:DUF1287 domain-containing protein [Brumimicrobium salinarum]PKR80518.1 DUF1287 domain-containing protein [Brumimicrobium salinarum]
MRFIFVFSLFFLLISNIQAQGSLTLAEAALTLTNDKVTYDPSYFSIAYPNGDVPSDKGVCTDVVIRAYRKVGIDLQKEVHEDMRRNFGAYPKNWGLKSTDKNIDHRRVPNLRTFFERKNAALPITNDANAYLPGDIVTWELTNGMKHIGIVADKKSRDKQRPLIVHNIGAGQVLEDCLFRYKITGHYRYNTP